jgi:hypothetical protein
MQLGIEHGRHSKRWSRTTEQWRPHLAQLWHELQRACRRWRKGHGYTGAVEAVPAATITECKKSAECPSGHRQHSKGCGAVTVHQAHGSSSMVTRRASMRTALLCGTVRELTQSLHGLQGLFAWDESQRNADWCHEVCNPAALSAVSSLHVKMSLYFEAKHECQSTKLGPVLPSSTFNVQTWHEAILLSNLDHVSCTGLNNIWIVKPSGKSRGRGIALFNSSSAALWYTTSSNDSQWIVQKYIERPLLVHRRKFDIRQWVLVSSWSPVTAWFYEECYLRFAVGKYSTRDLGIHAHLSNNSVTKSAQPDFQGACWCPAHEPPKAGRWVQYS